MLQEFKTLEANHTWDLVSLPPHKKFISCKWVYKIKHESDGSVERYKALLVIRGDTQKEGIDFNETFFPVVKFTTIKVLLSIAVKGNWTVYQLDVNNAFLYGDLAEEVYMKLPLGLTLSSSILTSAPLVCRLRKSLYGLKQASRQWFSKLSDALSIRGYSSSINDYSLFTKSAGDFLIVLAVYVDDILLAGDDVAELDDLNLFFDDQFKIKDLGLVYYFLGFEITSHSQGYLISQQKFTSDLLFEFHCDNFSHISTLMLFSI